MPTLTRDFLQSRNRPQLLTSDIMIAPLNSRLLHLCLEWFLQVYLDLVSRSDDKMVVLWRCDHHRLSVQLYLKFAV